MENTLDQKMKLPKFTGNVNGKKYHFIVDGSCEENLVSINTVELMGLEVDWYTRPDQIEWSRNGGVILRIGGCRFPLSFGKYANSNFHEIVDMDICDVVLGRPWLFDVGAVRNNQENRCEFMWGKTKVILIPRPKPTEETENLEVSMFKADGERLPEPLIELKETASVTMLRRSVCADSKSVSLPSSREVFLQDDVLAPIEESLTMDDAWTNQVTEVRQILNNKHFQIDGVEVVVPKSS